MNNRDIEQLRDHLYGGAKKRPPPPKPGPAVAPEPDDVIRLRERIERLKPKDRRFAEVDLPRQVRWLSDSMYGLHGRSGFIQEHPDILGLLRRMILRARAHGDPESERQLVELAVAFQTTIEWAT